MPLQEGLTGEIADKGELVREALASAKAQATLTQKVLDLYDWKERMETRWDKQHSWILSIAGMLIASLILLVINLLVLRGK